MTTIQCQASPNYRLRGKHRNPAETSAGCVLWSSSYIVTPLYLNPGWLKSFADKLKNLTFWLTHFVINVQTQEEKSWKRRMENCRHEHWPPCSRFGITDSVFFTLADRSLNQTLIRHLSLSPAQSDTVGSNQSWPQEQPAARMFRPQNFYCSAKQKQCSKDKDPKEQKRHQRV